jgi:hypothetical protein
VNSADVLCTLRGLNRLTEEAKRFPMGSSQRDVLEAQASEMHDWLPLAIAEHHDFLARSGRQSLAVTVGSSCCECRAGLGSALMERLASLGRFAVCPTCQVLLCSPETMGAESRRLVASGRPRCG